MRKLKLNEQKCLAFLDKTFFLLGWFILGTTVVVGVVTLWTNRLGLTRGTAPLLGDSLFGNAILVFRSAAEGCFAILMSHVFGMLRGTRKVGSKDSLLYVKLCCGAYALTGLIRIYYEAIILTSDIKHLIATPSEYETWETRTIWALGHFANLVTPLMPLLIGLSIYCLYVLFIRRMKAE